jgi:MFS transporter, DHA1 family, chloramphenicol resistance protein
MSGGGAIKMAEEIKAFKNKAYWKACATSCLILGASFAAFSYFVPVLTDVSEFTMQTVPFILMLYGLANIIGNMVTGRLAYRHSLTVMVVGLTILSSEGEAIALCVRVCSSVPARARLAPIKMATRLLGKRRFCTSACGSVGVWPGSRA